MMGYPIILVEVLATVVESVLAIHTVAQIAQKRLERLVYRWVLVMSSLLMTLLITALNQIQAFSFVTIFVSMVCVVLITGVTSSGDVLLRATASVITYFVIHTLDYVLAFTIGVIGFPGHNTAETFTMLMQPGWQRIFYLIVDKGADCLLYVMFRKTLLQLRPFSHKFYCRVFPISFLLYVVTSTLFSMIAKESVFSLRTAVIALWIFSLLCLVGMIVIFCLSDRYRKQKYNNELFDLTNRMMAENYRHLYEKQQAFAKETHDFHHHLVVLRQLAHDAGDAGTEQYIDSLLEKVSMEGPVCQSGCHVIDAIVNCKAAEAKNEGIRFTYRVNIPKMPNVEPSDLCAVLSNQLENAMEACRKLTGKEKWMHASIWMQTENMIFFKVINPVEKNPILPDGRMVTSKKDDKDRHGLGLTSIQAVAEKYNGVMRVECRNGKFVSMVFLCSRPAEEHQEERRNYGNRQS